MHYLFVISTDDFPASLCSSC